MWGVLSEMLVDCGEGYREEITSDVTEVETMDKLASSVTRVEGKE